MTKLLTILTLLFVAMPAIGQTTLTVGTLQSSLARVDQTKAAGITLATVSVSWDRFEPAMGKYDQAYIQTVRDQIAGFRKVGLKVQLDFGIQYPPAWIKKWPNSRYVNQYGDAYIDPQPGKDVVNGVFNESIRLAQAAYVAAVFREMGTDFHAVRLGWNYFGELGYPAAKFKDHTNCYWAFDDLASEQQRGLTKSLKPNPRRDWKPGQPNANGAAEQFLGWYLDALVDYQRFQIATVRQHYNGRLVMLYGSWGIRPGMVEKELQGDLANPKQTELSLGYDFDRLIGAVDDPLVFPCTTWIDANPDFGKDPPVAYLAGLLKAHPKQLQLWAENPGHADLAAMKLSFERARACNVSTLIWAFEPDLFDGKHASLKDLQDLIEPRTK